MQHKNNKAYLTLGISIEPARASNSKMALEQKLNLLQNQVMQYGSFFDIPATRYGKDMEPITQGS